MPFRLTSSVGVQGNSFLQPHHWELNASYRYLTANGQDFFVGTQRTPPPPATQPPGGQPIEVDVHTLTLGVTYAASQQIRVSIIAPIQHGQVSFIEGDNARHTETVTALGDVAITGNAWLLNPREHPTGNVTLGLGLKMPTGSQATASNFLPRRDRSSELPTHPFNRGMAAGASSWGCRRFNRSSRGQSLTSLAPIF
jgi:hypothetical protein